MNRMRFGLSRPLLLTVFLAGQLSAHAGDAPRNVFQETSRTQVPIGWPYKAIPVVHPELMAGSWEAADPSGTIDYLLIRMTTISVMQEERLASVSVSGSIRLGNGEPIRLSINAWLPGPFVDPALNTVWSDRHLRLGPNVRATAAVLIDMLREVPIELDLAFDETRLEWTGTFAGRGMSKPVRFSRPRPSVRAPLIDPLVGYWCTEEPGRASCVRIIEGADGHVRVWEDLVSWYGRPEDGVTTQGQYGEERSVFETPAPDAIGFAQVLGTGVGGYAFRGRLSSDGTRLEGQQTWAFAPPNSGFDPRPWTLIKSDTGAWPASSQRPWPASPRRP